MDDGKLSMEPRQPRRRGVQHTRTRNGCERCRARRRKCDEGKPQCQRCTDARVRCQYATHLFMYDSASSSSPLKVSHVTIPPRESHAHSTTQATLHTEPLPSGQGFPLSRGNIHLLHHYTRFIAPWIDICDRDRSFGRLVPRLAMTHLDILDAIIQLSAESSSFSNDLVKTSTTRPVVLRELGTTHYTDPTSYLLLMISFVLQKMQNFTESVPDTWDNFFSRGSNNTSFVGCSFDNSEHRRAWLAIGGLMSRLEIAYALMFETVPALESRVLREALKTYRPLDLEIDSSFTTFDTYLQCIAILTDVARLCFGPPGEISTESPVLTAPVSDGEHIHRWKSILTELHAWYSNRAPELLPLYEDDGNESGFPMVVFVDDAGVSVNMMYHAAMFLLLEHEEPSSLSRGGRHEQTETKQEGLVPLWHARRVCGIALTSDQHCWDPCMIAAFFLAARQMRHPDQQRDLLACLDCIEAAGWRVNSLVRKLREEWLIPVGPEGNIS